MPSDSEEFVPTTVLLNREKFQSRFNNTVNARVSTRWNPHAASISEWFSGNHVVKCFAADAYRFNALKRRWVRKGPVIVCLIASPEGKNRILAYYLHGAMSVAFNFAGEYLSRLL
jgi:hypothetical protein